MRVSFSSHSWISSVVIHLILIGGFWVWFVPKPDFIIPSLSRSLRVQVEGLRKGTQVRGAHQVLSSGAAQVQEPVHEPVHEKGDLDLFSHYLLEIRSQVEAVLEYPLALRRLHVEGETLLKITLGSQGQVLEIQVVRGSGSLKLDSLAVKAVQAAAPFSVPPVQVARASSSLGSLGSLSFQLPVQFRMSMH